MSKLSQVKPLRVTEEEAERYAANLVEHMREGDVQRWQFLSVFVRHIVLYDTEGTIELAEQPALEAHDALLETISINKKSILPQRKRHYAPRLVNRSGSKSR